MNKTASTLTEKARKAVCDELNNVLADGIDLYSHIKGAHWNLKGPLFVSLHLQFDDFAGRINAHNDAIAERAVILGAVAYGTVKHVAKHSRLKEYDMSAVKDLDHVKQLAERVTEYVKNLNQAHSVAEKQGDGVSVDMLIEIMEDAEKIGWYLYATLGK